jgi:hypothetical protein
MRVAIRRTLRVGEHSGTPVEDIGIKPDSRHAMTKDDLLQDNKDLIDKAAAILKNMPVRRLSVTTSRAGPLLKIEATTVGISRLDIYIDGRPQISPDVDDGTHKLKVDLPAGAVQLELAGFKNDALVAARKLKL